MDIQLDKIIATLTRAYEYRNQLNTEEALALLQGIDTGNLTVNNSINYLCNVYSNEIEGHERKNAYLTLGSPPLQTANHNLENNLSNKITTFLNGQEPEKCYWALAEYLRKHYQSTNSLNKAEQVYTFLINSERIDLANLLTENYLFAARLLEEKYTEPGQLIPQPHTENIHVNSIPLPSLSGNANEYKEQNQVNVDPVESIFIWGACISENNLNYWLDFKNNLNENPTIVFICERIEHHINSNLTIEIIKDLKAGSLLTTINTIKEKFNLTGKVIISHAGVKLSQPLNSYVLNFSSHEKTVVSPSFIVENGMVTNDATNYIQATKSRIENNLDNNYHLRSTFLFSCFNINILKTIKAQENIDNMQYCATEFFWRLENNGAYFVAPEKALCLISLKVIHDIQPLFGYTYTSRKRLCNLYPLSPDRDLQKIYTVPLLDIYIPMYNAEKYIEEAINSCLNQTIKDLRICISDDGSSDRSLEIVERLQKEHENIILESHENAGISITTMKAIGLGNGLLIGQLDSDDLLMPNAAEELIKPLLKDEYLGCAYAACDRIDANGNFIKKEYNFPQFNRNKMLSTSICHHFRMWKRKYYNRTTHFNPFIVNGIDYDFFSKLSETTKIEHINKILYKRRWHGENTSIRRESDQTRNTYICILNSLKRQNLNEILPLSPDRNNPRNIKFITKKSRGRVVTFPDFSYSNPYQILLYSGLGEDLNFGGGDIDSAIGFAKENTKIIFHLHWLTKIISLGDTPTEAKLKAEEFITKLEQFKKLGGTIIWTIHNNLEHDKKNIQEELILRENLCAVSDYIHLHDEANIAEILAHNPTPKNKLIINSHGNYINVYGKFNIEHRRQRIKYGFKNVLIFGQLREYKNLSQLTHCVQTLSDNGFNVTVAGKPSSEKVIEIFSEKFKNNSNITLKLKRITNGELHDILLSHEIGLLSYTSILTSGTLRLFQSYGIIPIAPELPLFIREILNTKAGYIYSNKIEDSINATCHKLKLCSTNELLRMSELNYTLAKELNWSGELTTIIEKYFNS